VQKSPVIVVTTAAVAVFQIYPPESDCRLAIANAICYAKNFETTLARGSHYAGGDRSSSAYRDAGTG
jgi:hypothetical protein